MQIEGACPGCDSTTQSEIGVNPDFTPSRILSCAACGLIWTSPTPSDTELSSRYQQEYRKLRQEQVTESFLAARDLRAQAQRRFILENRPEWNSLNDLEVMDVGCAAGSLLAVFAANARTMTGYEPDEQMASAARDRMAGRADIRESLLEAPSPGASSYDLICMSHVLEHARDPVATLRRLFGYCKDRGLVFLEVPNESRSTVRGLCDRGNRGVFHLFFFRPNDLQRCIARAGGKVLRIGTYGEDLQAPPLLGPGGMRRLANGISRRLFRSERAKRSRMRRAMFYENPRGGVWIRCLCVPRRNAHAG